MPNYIKTVKYPCCQLVTLFNVCRFFGMKHPALYTPEFEELVDLVGCRHGSALFIEKAAVRLGLVIKEGELSYQWIKNHLPVSLAVHDPKYGFHNILIVKAYRYRLQVCSFSPGRDILWSELKTYCPTQDHNQKVRSLRPFGI